MKNLIRRHQVACWERGVIRPETTVTDFLEKIDEEMDELNAAYILNKIDPDSVVIFSPEMAHEAVDLCAVVINMLTFYGVDFVDEFLKNVEYQESRVI